MQIQIGDKASVTMTITESLVLAFAELTGNTNPLHVDAMFAQGTRYGRRVAQGMLTGSLISSVLGTRLPGPGTIYLSQNLRFLRPVYIGDTLTAVVEVLSRRTDKPIMTLRTDCFNQHGEQVVSGEAVVLLDTLSV